MKPVLVLSLVTALGIGGAYLAVEPVTPLPVISQIQEISPLERARRSTVLLYLTDYNSGGTATLVGRKKLDNGSYRYRALTAYHVLRGMFDKITKGKADTSKKITLMFQPTFHGAPLRLKLDIDDIDWASPTEDWVSFTFNSIRKLTCAKVATKTEFLAIKSFEKIYAIGAGGLYGIMCRDGIMGSTHNEYLDKDTQLKDDSRPWNQQPHKFFRPYVNVWYGDSGGGVFNKDGKLIGIINGFNMMFMGWDQVPVTHSGVAIKAYIIKELASPSKDFFLIED